MKTVHEFFTNKRIEDSRFEYLGSYSWMVGFVQVESFRGRMSKVGRQVEGLFHSLLAEAFS